MSFTLSTFLYVQFESRRALVLMMYPGYDTQVPPSNENPVDVCSFPPTVLLVAVYFYLCFKLYFTLFQTHYHTYPTTKEYKILNQGKI